jgi:serine/threonine protein kinase
MDHPNIAKVLEAGATESGRPYFVMELVRGTPITQYCDENCLSVQERLELFISVCDAVQHAHQKGIIHRDIKPTNVLVTLHDGKPVAKVIDFGVAKATGQRLTDRSLFTSFAQMIGTPLYMLPEQAEMSGLDIDTRSDIYSMGVMLYELLTGTTPFDKARLRDAAYDEIRRIIQSDSTVANLNFAVRPSTPNVPGDYNKDGSVSDTDYGIWRAAFGATGLGLSADGNGNGIVDAADYVLWRKNRATFAAVVPATLASAELTATFDATMFAEDFQPLYFQSFLSVRASDAAIDTNISQVRSPELAAERPKFSTTTTTRLPTWIRLQTTAPVHRFARDRLFTQFGRHQSDIQYPGLSKSDLTCDCETDAALTDEFFAAIDTFPATSIGQLLNSNWKSKLGQ